MPKTGHRDDFGRGDALRRELKAVHDELARTNSELLQLTLELDDRVEKRTSALRKSEAELRRHRDHLEIIVEERTAQLKRANADLQRHVLELRASEERFEGLVRTIPDIVYRITPQGMIVFINEAVTRIGFRPEELVGRHFNELIRPLGRRGLSRVEVLPGLSGHSAAGEDTPKFVDERRTGSRKTAGLVVGLRTKGGEAAEPAELNSLGPGMVVAEINSAGLYEINEDAEEKVFIGTVGVIRDVTARRAMEQKLHEAYGTMEQKVVERTRELEDANTALRAEIEERRKVETRLRESEENYRTLFEHAADSVFLLDFRGHLLDVNERAVEKLGYSREVLLSKRVYDLVTQEYAGTRFRQRMRRMRRDGRITFEISFLSSDGREIPHEVSSSMIQFGRIPAVLSIARDITARKRAEKDLVESEQLLQSILDGIGAAVFHVDPATYEIVDTNDAGCGLLGLSRKDILGSRCCDIICPDGQRPAGQGCRLYMNKILDHEAQLRLPGGRIIPVTKHVLPVDIRGRRRHIEILFDLTERKALERQLAYAQKLESIGQLAAGIAHEINTPIQYVGGNINYFEETLTRVQKVLSACDGLLAAAGSGLDVRGEADRVREVLEATRMDSYMKELPGALADSREGVERVASIVMAMKKFSHPDVETRKPVDVNKAIENTITIARNEWKYCSTVRTRLSPDVPFVHCVPGDFNQVMLNLIVNAAHANAAKYVGEGPTGIIDIQTEFDGERVVITIGDTGIGIAPEYWDRVFDPFFTTKEVGKGTGQGLAITHSIMEKHDGAISFTPEPGEGTAFVVVFPVGGPPPGEAVTDSDGKIGGPGHA